MTLQFVVKLLLLSLASFFLIQLAVGALVVLVAPLAMRFAERSRPAATARLMLALRLFPATFSALLVAGICVPSYLWFEPRAASSEQAGLVCVAGALFAILAWAMAMKRSLKAIVNSRRYVRDCERNGRRTHIAGDLLPAWIIYGTNSLFAIGGIWRPRLFLSPDVARVLTEEQLAAAVRHERAHWTSRDNLKRLLLLLAPDIVPFLSLVQNLDRGWAKYMERAADDRAAGGDTDRSVALATALVQIARLGVAPRAPVLMAPLLADNDDLSGRVERLLASTTAVDKRSPARAYLLTAGAITIAGGLVLLSVRPSMLAAVHGLLERLIQ